MDWYKNKHGDWTLDTDDGQWILWYDRDDLLWQGALWGLHDEATDTFPVLNQLIPQESLDAAKRAAEKAA